MDMDKDIKDTYAMKNHISKGNFRTVPIFLFHAVAAFVVNQIP